MTETNIGSDGSGIIPGQIIELNPAFPSIHWIGQMGFVRNGFAVLSGYDPSLEHYKSVVTGFSEVAGVGAVKAVFGEKGVLIAVGDNGLLKRSTDGGASWSALVSPLITNFTCGLVINGIYIAAGAASNIIRSTDGGLTWSVVVIASAGSWTDIATNGVVMMMTRSVGAGQGIWKTTDFGLNWFASADGYTAAGFRSIAYSNGKWCACYNLNGDSIVNVSNTDGRTWQATSPGSASGVGPAQVVAKDGFWFFVSATGSSHYVSTNNLAHFKFISMGFSPGLNFKPVIIGSRLFCMGIANNSILYGAEIHQILRGSGASLFFQQPIGHPVTFIGSANSQIFMGDNSKLTRSINGVGFEIESDYIVDPAGSSNGDSNISNDRYFMRFF